MSENLRSPQFWLAELDQYGNPKLCDGSHSSRVGVEQAMFLFKSLGLERGRRFACAEVVLTHVDAKPHNANLEALSTLNAIGFHPKAAHRVTSDDARIDAALSAFSDCTKNIQAKGIPWGGYAFRREQISAALCAADNVSETDKC